MNKLIALIGLVLVACFVCSGCAQYLKVMDNISTQLGAGVSGSSIPITAADSYTIVGDASGSSWSPGIFGMQLKPNSAYEALQQAKKKYDADGLINITADNKVYYIPPIYPIITIHVIQVRGQAIRFRRGGDEN